MPAAWTVTRCSETLFFLFFSFFFSLALSAKKAREGEREKEMLNSLCKCMVAITGKTVVNPDK